MTKYKTTRKAMKEGYNNILCVGYCNLQYLLQYKEPFAYSTRAEGWACDYYNVDGVIISTGYAPIGKTVSYDLSKKYDNMARKIRDDYSLSYEERKEKITALLSRFIKEV